MQIVIREKTMLSEGAMVDTFIDHTDVSLIEDSILFNDQCTITLKSGKEIVVAARASAVMLQVNQARNDAYQWPK